MRHELSTWQRPDGFLENDDRDIVVYTDGACLDNGQRIINANGGSYGSRSGLGIYFGKRYSFSIENEYEHTNNFAEAAAIEWALNYVINNLGWINSVEVRNVQNVIYWDCLLLY